MCQHKNHSSSLSKHQEEHSKWTRRNFLTKTGIFTGASMLLSSLPIQAFSKTPFGNINKANNDNILVLLQLKGGNDGLNTIIPYYDYGTYKAARRRIHISKEESIRLTKDFGMHGALKPLQALWNKGMMKVVNNVGYPSPNLSHFKSSDIWMSGSEADTTLGTGWIGRFMDRQYPNFHKSPTPYPAAVGVGDLEDLTFQGKLSQFLMQIENPRELYEIAKTGESFGKVVGQSKYAKELQFLRTVCNSTQQYAKEIQKSFKKGQTQANYTENSLSNQLRRVARLIKGGLGTKVYMVSLEGFDTHAGQTWKHERLMEQLATAISAFYEDLATQGKLNEKVITMTFSEFGRRMEENGSGGTDHGTSAPVMFFGKGLGGRKIIGEPADLKHLDKDGNLSHSIDFREVYASVLEDWMGASATHRQQILGKGFQPVKGIF